MAVIKLDKKIQRVQSPAALPNGNTTDLRWYPITYPTPPYITNSVLASAGGFQQRSGYHADSYANPGFAGSYYSPRWVEYNPGLNIRAKGNLRMYIEVEEINGACVFGSADRISSVGPQFIEFAAADLYYFRIRFDTSYFLDDPNFKRVAVGQLPTSNSEMNGWYCAVSNLARKDNDGRIYLNNNDSNMSQLKLNASWASAGVNEYDITVDYLPPGAQLRVYSAGGGAAQDITSPGRYIFRAGLNGGEFPTITTMTQVPGETIISRFMVKGATQPWVTEGDLKLRLSCIWVANVDDFDKIQFPKYPLCLANQFSHKPANSPYPTDPQLGFGAYVPPAGPANIGDTIRNAAWVSGQPVGWRCIASGNPGTWMPLASM